MLRAKIESVRRKRADENSEGDFARTSLDLQVAASVARLIGGGLAHSIPLLAATSACESILELPASERWSIQSLKLDLMDVCPPTGEMRGEARLEDLIPGRASFAVAGRVANAALYRGTVVYRIYPSRSGVVFDGASRPLFTVLEAPESMALGATARVTLEFHVATTIRIVPPYGRGLRVLEGDSFQASPGRRSFAISADRPHEVNLGRPWRLSIQAVNDAVEQKVEIAIRVPDPEPGRIFYILTDDCETFDGGPLTGDYGAAAILGNHNNFMDPEEYMIQMVAKPERMNSIADRHGAKWTHFWAVHQRFAAAWATTQSTTRQWDGVVAALDRSIREGSIRHEYAPHLHCDYEPASRLPPQPRLIYDSATDGILPNEYWDRIENPTHRYHDWDGAARGGPGIKALGDEGDADTKTGSLFKAVQHLSALQAHHRHTLCGRTGSFDFGATPEDQAISTEAYRKVGLKGNSDALFPGGEPLAGGHLFWCRCADRFSRTAELPEACLVQMAVTRDMSFESLEDVNGWFDKHWPSCRGAGVHALVAMCHAMFMRGTPDPFRSLDGGCFEVLDRHLAWVRENYPDVEFVTASEAVVEFLDYYTPEPMAIADPRLVDGDLECGRFVFSLRLLGRGIFIGAGCAARVEVQAPAFFHPSDVVEIVVRAGEEVLARSSGHRICVEVNSASVPLRLEVMVAEHAIAKIAAMWWRESEAQIFHGLPERRERDLLTLRAPLRGQYAMDGVRLIDASKAAAAIVVLGALLDGIASIEWLSLDVVFVSEELLQDFSVAVHEGDGVTEAAASGADGEVLANAKFRRGSKPSAFASWRSQLRRVFEQRH